MERNKKDYKRYGGLTETNLSIFIAQWCFRNNHIRYAPKNQRFLLFCKAIAKYVPLAKEVKASDF